jgi:hypothetical protein
VGNHALKKVDRESLKTLATLLHSIEASLSGLDNRIRRELEVVEVSLALAKRAGELLNDLVSNDTQEVP